MSRFGVILDSGTAPPIPGLREQIQAAWKRWEDRMDARTFKDRLDETVALARALSGELPQSTGQR